MFRHLPLAKYRLTRAIKSAKISKLINTESCPSGRRCSTRNAVWGNSPRVRIPNSPPEKIPQLIQLYPLRYCYCEATRFPNAMREGFLFSYLKALHINSFKNKALHSWSVSPTLQRFFILFSSAVFKSLRNHRYTVYNC